MVHFICCSLRIEAKSYLQRGMKMSVSVINIDVPIFFSKGVEFVDK